MIRHRPRSPGTRADPGHLRVLTYNTHHGADRGGRLDLAAVGDTIARCDADVVALQEVDRHWSERSEHADQPAWYAQRLGMAVDFVPNVSRPAQPGRTAADYGLAVLSRLPVRSATHELYQGTLARDVEPRGLQQVLVSCRDAAGAVRDLRVVNTHLSVASARLRRAEVGELLSHADAAADLPTVVAGDFNAAARSREMRTVRSIFTDAWQAGRGPARTSGLRRIDYLWVSAQLRPVRTLVIASPASDHYPVVTDLAWT